MMKKILILIPIILIAGVLLFIFTPKKTQDTDTKINQEADTETVKQIPGYEGNLLTGNSSPYLEFTKNDYEKALSENKIIFLDFYANWCPICRAEAPDITEGFNSLETDQIVGFRVNFNDSETDEDEKQLAENFKIPYQHTKVILKNGQEVKRSGEQWDKETFLREINSVL